MKNRLLLVLTSLLSILCVLSASSFAQKRPSAAPRKVTFEQLSDFVNGDNRRLGDKAVVSDVPVPPKITFEKPYGMYLFDPNGEGGVSTSFYTSLAVKKVLQPNLGSGTSSLRIGCSLIEFVGEFDVYRMCFATKIEGIDENGAVKWTAVGAPPAKLKWRQ